MIQAILSALPPVIDRPFVIGLSGVQGSGKSTLCAQLTKQIPRSITLSLDDFYLPFDQQISLSLGGNPFYKHRGLPGTHSIDLLVQTMTDLMARVPTQIPRYDKSLHNGRGDRVGMETVTEIDVILLEGWFVGYQSLSTDELTSHNFHSWYSLKDILQVNESLKDYETVWSNLDTLFVMVPESLDFIYDWRLEQEEFSKSMGKPGLDRDQVSQFVDTFMPLYHLYLPRLRQLENVFVLDHARNVVSNE